MVPLEGFAGRTAIALLECGARQAGQAQAAKPARPASAGGGEMPKHDQRNAPILSPVGLLRAGAASRDSLGLDGGGKPNNAL